MNTNKDNQGVKARLINSSQREKDRDRDISLQDSEHFRKKMNTHEGTINSDIEL